MGEFFQQTDINPTEEPSELQSIWLQTVRHDWATFTTGNCYKMLRNSLLWNFFFWELSMMNVSLGSSMVHLTISWDTCIHGHTSAHTCTDTHGFFSSIPTAAHGTVSRIPCKAERWSVSLMYVPCQTHGAGTVRFNISYEWNCTICDLCAWLFFNDYFKALFSTVRSS